MLDFLAGRSVAGVEKVDGETYSRVARMENREGKICAGWIRITHQPNKDALIATISGSLISVYRTFYPAFGICSIFAASPMPFMKRCM